MRSRGWTRGVQKLCRRPGLSRLPPRLAVGHVSPVNHGLGLPKRLCARPACDSGVLDVDEADLVFARARETFIEVSKLDRAQEGVTSRGAQIEPCQAAYSFVDQAAEQVTATELRMR